MFQINIKSFTHAQKALSFLQKHGIRCSVRRGFSKGSGCGFVLTVTDKNAGKQEVCALLGSIRIDCRST